MKDLEQYIALSHMMILATIDEEGKPYTANVYFGHNPIDFTFYFISRLTREHSQHIVLNQNIAWSIIDTNQLVSHKDVKRKGLQFQGIAIILDEDIGKQMYNKFYEEKIGFTSFPKEHVVFECKPTNVKIWDEGLYSGEGRIIKF